jgi:hypothetical protein
MGSEVDSLKAQLADALKQLAAATAALEVPQEEETKPTAVAAPAPEPKKEKPKPPPPPPPPPPAIPEPAPLVFEGFMRTPKFGKVDTRIEDPYPYVFIKGHQLDYKSASWPTGREALEKWEDWGASAGIQGPCRHLNPLPSCTGKMWDESGKPHVKSQFTMYNLEKHEVYPNKGKADNYLNKLKLPKEALDPVVTSFSKKDVAGFRQALSGVDTFLKDKPEWAKVRVLERELPKVLKPLMSADEKAAYKFFEECFDEAFMTDARQATLSALFSEPIDMRGEYKEEVYEITLPRNTPGVSQSVLQVNSADDGWEVQQNISWCPYAVMFASHTTQTLPQHRMGNYWPLGRDPGDEPHNNDWVEGINYAHPDTYYSGMNDYIEG